MPRLFVAAGIFHPQPGGPSTYLYELLPVLQRMGWQIDVLTYGDETPQPEAYPYPVTRVPRRVWPIRLLDYARQARPRLAQANLVYAHTIDLPLWGDKRAPRLIKIVGDQAWERCIRKGWIRPESDIDQFQTARLNALAAWQRRSRSVQVGAFDGVIVPSEYLRRLVQAWGVPPERIHVIYNALPPLDDQLPSRTELRHLLSLPQTAPIILTAARLTPWKGIDHLIAAMHRLPDALLLIVGSGDDQARLMSLAKPLGKRVRFLGQMPRTTLYRLMAAVDLFALYSGYEGLPHAVLESLRVGTPVVVSDKGGNSEIVRHEENGLLVPYVDVAALAQALRRAIDERERLALGTSLGLERFSLDYMAQATNALLRRYAK